MSDDDDDNSSRSQNFVPRQTGGATAKPKSGTRPAPTYTYQAYTPIGNIVYTLAKIDRLVMDSGRPFLPPRNDVNNPVHLHFVLLRDANVQTDAR